VAYWFENERRLPQERLSFLQWVVIGLMGLMLAGFWKLQVIDSEQYKQLAERNRIRTMPLLAPRGRMLDREGRVLVDNVPSFSIWLLRENAEEVRRSLPQISEGLGVTVEELEQRLEAAKNLPKFQMIPIKPDASPADLAFVESHRVDLPVLELIMEHRRRYPRGRWMSHAAGYVGEVSEQQIEKSNGRYRPGDMVGKTGLERQYNDILMGQDGLRRVVVNSVGREVGRLGEKEAIPGKDIQLTIDYDLQQVGEAALDAEGRKGAVVALDPRTGEVLAMVSHPAPDNNLFAGRIKPEEWKELNENPDHPLLDRAIQAQLAPGSTFKIVMGTAMLETKAIPENFTVFCPGTADFYGRTFRCHIWRKGGHGVVDLHKAVVESCDIFFYNVGKRLGIERIASYASQLGLGRRTGIDLPNEEAGVVPSEAWKERVLKQKWYAGETISVAIGQGALTVTPLQLAYSTGGIALGGVFRQPHLLKDASQGAAKQFPLAEHTVEKMTQAMFGVVNEGGTAAASRLQGIEFCGKTGTSQLISEEGLKKVGGPRRQFTENAWFVGYAPRRNPEIVVAVLVEHGEHGSTAAAPVAREIIKAYYDKKGQRDKQQYTVDYKRYEVPGTPAPAPLPAAAVAKSPKRVAANPPAGAGGNQR
jgi:penicillin-binding protein 2